MHGPGTPASVDCISYGLPGLSLQPFDYGIGRYRVFCVGWAPDFANIAKRWPSQNDDSPFVTQSQTGWWPHPVAAAPKSTRSRFKMPVGLSRVPIRGPQSGRLSW